MTKKLSTSSKKKYLESLTTEEQDIRFIYNELRKSSVIWAGRKEVLQLASKKVFVRRSKTGKAIYKTHWNCAACRKWFKDINMMEVDHITEVGGVTSFNGDWNEMIRKIMPRPVSEHMQALCIGCHLKKTNNYNSAMTKYVRKEKS